jgi:nicotinate-nucleotide adenylyltransferase
MPLIGILGGTFDPIHFGHLRLAEEMAQRLGLAEVRFIPSGRPWHRGAPGAAPEQRLEMVRLGVAGNPHFRVDDREVRQDAPGYTVETLGSLRRELGGEQPLCLLLGADAFLGLPAWRRWHELFDLAHVAVAWRPGFTLDLEQMPQPLRQAVAARITGDPGELQGRAAGGVVACPVTPLDISATAIRDLVRSGKSPRYLLPEAVLDYIQTHNLYR